MIRGVLVLAVWAFATVTACRSAPQFATRPTMALADTLSATETEARSRDSLAAVTCVQDVAERIGFEPWISGQTYDARYEVLQFRRRIADSTEVVQASIRIDTDSVRVWEGAPPTTRMRRTESSAAEMVQCGETPAVQFTPPHDDAG